MQKFMFNEEEITEDLGKIGVQEGDAVLVHSSLSRIGYVPGGAQAVIDALLRTVGSSGTIVVPTITGQMSDSPENPPHFSCDKPSWTGTVPEILRKREDARRSNHPTHSVAALGNLAKKITQGHEDTPTPCGEGSPYLGLAHADGKILFLGASLNSNTTFHSVEELARLYYHLQPEPSTCKLNIHGRQVERRMLLHAWGTPRTFAAKERDLADAGIGIVGYIGRARSVLINASEMIDFALERLQKDRLYLVQKESVSFGCIAGCFELISKGSFDSMKISLYLPRKTSISFADDLLKFEGVEMNFSDSLKLNSGTLRLQSKVAGTLRLEGGYNYWLRFAKKQNRTEINVVDHARSDSFAGMGL